MKLLNYIINGHDEINFGVIIYNRAVSFKKLQKIFRKEHPELNSIRSYLKNFPKSEELARDLFDRCEDNFSEGKLAASHALNTIKILPPVPAPPAVMDFGLSPRHLRDATITMIRRQLPLPLNWIMMAGVRALFRESRFKGDFKYYKCNNNSFIGDMDETIWPLFSSYLDVEPELGIVIGDAPLYCPKGKIEKTIAGYTIYNDFSARDVQWHEMIGLAGPARCKDFECGNGAGPFLVTTDEIPDPLSLGVSVKVGDRYTWKGNTSGYIEHPYSVVENLTRFRSLEPGTILGMGTVPGCCGLERNEWLLPGEKIQITFEKIGTLRQIIPLPEGKLEKPKWRKRPELEKYY
jgi:2-keto-4-pentenoate hydratase/2-oxohepta-3-ene-1,7-dioic acid hydratase in catechol pathway